jgi:RNA polymerase sigma-70 factor (ECF subfamily)
MEKEHHPPDDELMANVGRGDLEAFELLVVRHQTAAWKSACRFLGDPRDAQDLVQEAFLRILEAAPRYRAKGTFPAYLRRIVANLCMDRAKKMGPFFTDVLPDRPDPAPSGETAAILQEDADFVRVAIGDLLPMQRMVVLLRYYEDLSYSEIADALGLTVKSVERHLARAREHLCSILVEP